MSENPLEERFQKLTRNLEQYRKVKIDYFYRICIEIGSKWNYWVETYKRLNKTVG
jgi:hypothetical protein